MGGWVGGCGGGVNVGVGCGVWGVGCVWGGGGGGGGKRGRPVAACVPTGPPAAARPAQLTRPCARGYVPYWALNFIVLLLAGFSKPVRGHFADPHAAGERLSTARYQFNLT